MSGKIKRLFQLCAMRLQFFRNFLAENSESLLGFPTIFRGGSKFSLRFNWKRIVGTGCRKLGCTVGPCLVAYDGALAESLVALSSTA
jgi:hypothetical protein